jgi:hypothetical protein
VQYKSYGHAEEVDIEVAEIEFLRAQHNHVPSGRFIDKFVAVD